MSSGGKVRERGAACSVPCVSAASHPAVRSSTGCSCCTHRVRRATRTLVPQGLAGLAGDPRRPQEAKRFPRASAAPEPEFNVRVFASLVLAMGAFVTRVRGLGLGTLWLRAWVRAWVRAQAWCARERSVAEPNVTTPQGG